MPVPVATPAIRVAPRGTTPVADPRRDWPELPPVLPEPPPVLPEPPPVLPEPPPVLPEPLPVLAEPLPVLVEPLPAQPGMPGRAAAQQTPAPIPPLTLRTAADADTIAWAQRARRVSVSR